MNRRITATLMRSEGPGLERKPVWVRRYNWLDTALPRATALAINYGQPGDAVVLHFSETGFEIAVLTVSARCRIEIAYSALVNSLPKFQALLKGV